jgi:hypothetical protein
MMVMSFGITAVMATRGFFCRQSLIDGGEGRVVVSCGHGGHEEGAFVALRPLQADLWTAASGSAIAVALSALVEVRGEAGKR